MLGLQMAREICWLMSRNLSAGLHRNILKHMHPTIDIWSARSSHQNIRSVTARDYSLPNPSWRSEMQRLYEHYNSMCEVETEGGEKLKGPWMRLASYNRFLKYAPGGQCLSKIMQAKARLFTRNIEEQGAGFEYVVFVNKQEKTCVCVFQAGHLLEGPPGHVHGGAIATIMDSVTGTHATYLSGPVVTANLTINYRSPIPLGSVVLVHSSLDKIEGRKTLLSCQVTSSDGSKLYTDATALFISVSMGNLLKRNA